MSTAVQQKAFSRDFLDRQDPTEGIGQLITPFSFYNVYDNVGSHDDLKKICEELYDKVLTKLQSKEMGENIGFEIHDYHDAQQGTHEDSRRYLVITRETNRKTRITILARFLPYGNKLYVGVDAYVLGNVNWAKVAGFLAITLLPLACYVVYTLGQSIGLGNSNRSSFGEVAGSFFGSTLCCLLPWVAFSLFFLWMSTIRNFRQEGNIFLALRQSFNQIVSTNSFNLDDILMTLKSILPFILGAIREVFEKHGLDVKFVDQFAASIQNINNIQNVYGSFNAVAGAGGEATVNKK